MNRGRLSVLAAGLVVGSMLLAAGGCDIGTGAVQNGGRGPVAGGPGAATRAEQARCVGVWKADGRRIYAEMLRNKPTLDPRTKDAVIKIFDEARMTIRENGTHTFTCGGDSSDGRWHMEGTTIVFVAHVDGKDVEERGWIRADGGLEMAVVEQPQVGLKRAYFTRVNAARTAADGQGATRLPVTLFAGGPS